MEAWKKAVIVFGICFIVDPDMRRKGIAKALLGYACRYAEENGFEIINIPNGIIARKKLKVSEQ